MPDNDNFLRYLTREHARLDRELSEVQRGQFPGAVQVARLTKLKVIVEDQIAQRELTPRITEVA